MSSRNLLTSLFDGKHRTPKSSGSAVSLFNKTFINPPMVSERARSTLKTHHPIVNPSGKDLGNDKFLPLARAVHSIGVKVKKLKYFFFFRLQNLAKQKGKELIIDGLPLSTPSAKLEQKVLFFERSQQNIQSIKSAICQQRTHQLPQDHTLIGSENSICAKNDQLLEGCHKLEDSVTLMEIKKYSRAHLSYAFRKIARNTIKLEKAAFEIFNLVSDAEKQVKLDFFFRLFHQDKIKLKAEILLGNLNLIFSEPQISAFSKIKHHHPKVIKTKRKIEHFPHDRKPRAITKQVQREEYQNKASSSSLAEFHLPTASPEQSISQQSISMILLHLKSISEEDSYIQQEQEKIAPLLRVFPRNNSFEERPIDLIPSTLKKRNQFQEALSPQSRSPYHFSKSRRSPDRDNFYNQCSCCRSYDRSPLQTFTQNSTRKYQHYEDLPMQTPRLRPHMNRMSRIQLNPLILPSRYEHSNQLSSGIKIDCSEKDPRFEQMPKLMHLYPESRSTEIPDISDNFNLFREMNPDSFLRTEINASENNEFSYQENNIYSDRNYESHNSLIKVMNALNGLKKTEVARKSSEKVRISNCHSTTMSSINHCANSRSQNVKIGKPKNIVGASPFTKIEEMMMDLEKIRHREVRGLSQYETKPNANVCSKSQTQKCPDCSKQFKSAKKSMSFQSEKRAAYQTPQNENFGEKLWQTKDKFLFYPEKQKEPKVKKPRNSKPHFFSEDSHFNSSEKSSSMTTARKMQNEIDEIINRKSRNLSEMRHLICDKKQMRNHY